MGIEKYKKLLKHCTIKLQILCSPHVAFFVLSLFSVTSFLGYLSGFLFLNEYFPQADFRINCTKVPHRPLVLSKKCKWFVPPQVIQQKTKLFFCSKCLSKRLTLPRRIGRRKPNFCCPMLPIQNPSSIVS